MSMGFGLAFCYLVCIANSASTVAILAQGTNRPLLHSRPFVVLASGTYTEVRKRVSAFTTVTWSRDETPCPRSLLGLDRNRPSCCTSHMPYASQGYSIGSGSDKTSSQSCAGIISSCHLRGLGGGGQLLSPSPALHVESSPPFSLQTARLA